MSMNGNTKWRFGAAAVLGVLVALLIGTVASAQTAPGPANPGTGLCPGPAMMGGGPGITHEAIADALGITSQELWDARLAGKSIATLAQEQGVALSTVVDAALAAHSAQLGAAVEAGALTQAQADAMTAVMRSHIESAFAASGMMGPRGFGMMGGHGMMGPRFSARPREGG
jgi:hypothetical protein